MKHFITLLQTESLQAESRECRHTDNAAAATPFMSGTCKCRWKWIVRLQHCNVVCDIWCWCGYAAESGNMRCQQHAETVSQPERIRAALQQASTSVIHILIDEPLHEERARAPCTWLVASSM
jgi:hypothetical protein